MSAYYLGVDLGQVNDYTALALIERVSVHTTNSVGVHDELLGDPAKAGDTDKEYRLRYLKRYLGDSYVRIADRVVAVAGSPSLDGKSLRITVDATGVGRAVIDLMRERGLNITAVTITGGDAVSRQGWDLRVPKRDLISTMQVLLQNGQLRIPATLDLRDVLTHEMQNFKVKLSAETGHASYEHWRSSEHDDLVLALALALWDATRENEVEILGWI
ncbi:MAG: hypothetical protein KJO98_15405 [Rhodothermia bacterium]|nr:hypothetical protein [Rhodothermia bacterium]